MRYPSYTTIKDRHPAHHQVEVGFWHVLMVQRGYRERGTHHFKEEAHHQHLEGQRVPCQYAHNLLRRHLLRHQAYPLGFQVAAKGYPMTLDVFPLADDPRDDQSLNQKS